MPDEALDRVLRLVAEGRLTADEAGPILDALGQTGQAVPEPPEPPHPPSPPAAPGARVSAVRIEVKDAGRQVVNLRIPIALGRMALDHLPGLSGQHADLIRTALAEGRSGPILEVDDDDGDGVRIVLE